MKKVALLTVLLLCSFGLIAQTSYTIKGAVTDTMASYKLVNTTITILNQQDSTLVKFGRADAEGHFNLSTLRPGKFILLATYPGYADYAETFELDSAHTAKDFGTIDLILKSTLLQDVIIKGKVAAIKIKGDTTEYNAGSYEIAPNSKVEDLLRQLPGIQVDKDGKITAQGETVKKVLVDGEEFFGDDPTLVTKNIRSDMVDKVQLYDKKSDQATFTGIDDGEKTKTINLKLKEDKKNGYFGKLEGGAGTSRFYQNQAMFNAFKGKQRFSGYGIFGNTGQTGLGWEDNSKYGSSGNMEMSEDGGVMFFSSGDDGFNSWNGRYDGRGIPRAASGGLHYENKWDSDKHALNTNYKIGQVDVGGNSDNISQNNLPDGIISNNSAQRFDNSVFRQKADATYTIKPDSTSSLKFMIDGSKSNTRTNDSFNSFSRRADSSFINTSDRKLSNDSEKQGFNASALWSKKLKKKGRTLLLNIREAYRKTSDDGYLYSTNSFYGEGALPGSMPDSTRTIDQQKVTEASSNSLNGNLTYTEPLSKSFSLVVNYGLGLINSSSDRRSYNKSASGLYDQLDTQFSNDFQLDQLSNKGGIAANYNKDKTRFSLGSDITNVNFNQYNGYTRQTFKRNFINVNPRASYGYRFSQQRAISINYYGYTNQPGIDQIQPVRVNTDPLNITLGNPDLRPSYSNSVSMYYNSYKIITEQSLWIYGSYQMGFNPITSSVTTDLASGKTTYQSINLSGKTPASFNLDINTDKKIKAIDLSVGLNLSANGNTSYNLTNGVLNKTSSNTFNGEISFGKYKAKAYNFRISGGPAYNTIVSSLQSAANNKGWGFNSNGSAGITLPGKIEISTDGNYEYKARTAAFSDNFSRFIWNATISKKFFRQENLALNITGRDLLNQNAGFSRYASGNTISQNSYTTIRRYFMFSLVWDFNKMGGAPAK